MNSNDYVVVALGLIFYLTVIISAYGKQDGGNCLFFNTSSFL